MSEIDLHTKFDDAARENPNTLQSTMKLPLTSVHARVLNAEAVASTESTAFAISVAWLSTYRPRFHLIAVFALPNRSSLAPKRGDTSFQFGRFSMAGKILAGTNCRSPLRRSGSDPLRESNRTPMLSVSCRTVHCSCAK